MFATHHQTDGEMGIKRFLDNLVDSGLISSLMQYLILIYSNNQFLETFTELIHLSIPQQELVSQIEKIVNGLHLLMRADQRYVGKVMEFEIPSDLTPLVFDGFDREWCSERNK
jgi:hypothetical protein